MRGKSLALLVLALGCGLVASLGITQVLARRGETAPQADMASIYLAKADIAAGAIPGDESVKLEQWPKDKVPAGALVRQEDLTGRRAKYKIFAGQPILEPMLKPRGEMGSDLEIPKALRVVAIPVSPETVQSGLVQPGSRCDVQVFIRADVSLGIPETVSKTILQDIRVFAINDVTSTIDQNDPKGGEQHMPSARTVSLLVTPAQAGIVTLASQLGIIKLILRSADDNDMPKSQATTPRELLGDFFARTRDKEKVQANDETFRKWFELVRDTLKHAAAAPAETDVRQEPAKYTMRIWSGAESTDVLLTSNNGFASDTWTATNLPPRLHSTRMADAQPLGSPVSAAVKPQGAEPPAGQPSSPKATPPQTGPSQAPSPQLKINGPPPLGG